MIVAALLARARKGRLKPNAPPVPLNRPAVVPTGTPGAGQSASAAAQATPVQAAERASGLPPQLVKTLGSVVAPATLLVALLYYFGWSHAYWFCNYFGVNSTALGFTSTDYMMRSVDGLFVPMTVIASGALLAAWGHSLLRARLVSGSRPRAIRLLVAAMAIAGGTLAAAGLASVFTNTVLSGLLAAAPLSLGFGVLLLDYAAHLHRLTAKRAVPAGIDNGWAAVTEWAAVFMIVGLSLFWAATDYSAAVGRSRAIDFVAGLPSYPNAVVYSEHSLSLHAAGVRETTCKDSRAAYRFRYDGLKLVLASGGQYLFLPAGWTQADGTAILLPDTSSLRLEFFPPQAQQESAPSAC